MLSASSCCNNGLLTIEGIGALPTPLSLAPLGAFAPLVELAGLTPEASEALAAPPAPFFLVPLSPPPPPSVALAPELGEAPVVPVWSATPVPLALPQPTCSLPLKASYTLRA